MNNTDCLFCKIVRGEIPCTKVYEDESHLAFLDINPVNLGHTLIVPKAHSRNMFDAPDETLASLIKTGKRIAQAVKEGVTADGINIAINNEKAAGQIIFHLHMHIIPRTDDDGFRHWKGQRRYKQGEEAEIAEKIKLHI